MATVKSPKLLGKVKHYTGDYCCVPGCVNSRGKCKFNGKNVSFYKFPEDDKRRELWLKQIRRNVQIQLPLSTVTSVGKSQETPKVKVVETPFVPNKWSRVCSEHFTGGKKVDEPEHPAYIPVIFARNRSTNRQTQSAKKAGVIQNADSTVKKRKRSLSVGNASSGRPKRLTFDIECPTDHDYIRMPGIHAATDDQLEAEIQTLQEENSSLRNKLLRLENVKDDDNKFQFWTNLPNYGVFNALATYLKTRCNDGNLSYWRGNSTNISNSTTSRSRNRKFSFEDELFIVLVKLKTGNFNEDLAQTFNTSAGHISIIFSTWINFLNNELKLLFEMQSSECDVAECYESYDNLKIVLDCTELMLQRASNLDSRKKTFSNYKHHDTVKFLVGLSPNLAVNYVSRAWGGRASDKHITLNSNSLMEGLQCGETVMADRGFNINYDLKKKGVKLVIPEFKGRDRPQITKEEAKRSENISKARIHVERIIQRIKTFYLLERIIRLNMQDLVEQIFTVCAYLTNFQLPIIRRKVV